MEGLSEPEAGPSIEQERGVGGAASREMEVGLGRREQRRVEYRGRLGKGISGSVSVSATASRAGRSLGQEQGTGQGRMLCNGVTVATEMPSSSGACAGSCWGKVTIVDAAEVQVGWAGLACAWLGRVDPLDLWLLSLSPLLLLWLLSSQRGRCVS